MLHITESLCVMPPHSPTTMNHDKEIHSDPHHRSAGPPRNQGAMRRSPIQSFVRRSAVAYFAWLKISEKVPAGTGSLLGTAIEEGRWPVLSA